MNFRKYLVGIFILLTLSLTSVFLFSSRGTSEAGNNGKFINSHAQTIVTEGQFVLVEIRLTQPIICPSTTTTTIEIVPSDDLPCQVQLTLTPDDTNRVSLNVSQLTWLSNEWAMPRTFRINVAHDGIDNSDDVVVVNGVLTNTSAPFYFGETISTTVNITDLDDVTTTTTTTIAPVTTTTNISGQQDANISLSNSNLAPGKTIGVEGSGFKPDSDVTVTLHSNPLLLGTIRTNSSGSFSARFTISKDVAIGSHQVIAEGLNANGDQVSSVQALTISNLPATGVESFKMILVALVLVLIGSLTIILLRKSKKIF